MEPPRSVPVWVRTLDVVCILLAAIAAIVAVSGGFRVHVFSLRVAVTSPWPLLLWCGAIATARHVLAPDQPLYLELPHRLAAWWRTPAIRRATATVVGTRPAVLLVGYLAVFMFGFANGRAPLRHFDNELLNLPVRWDAGWYLDIVTNGYRYAEGDETVQQNIVFFPAYPMLTRTVGRLMGGDLIGYVAAGMTVSIAAFFGALVYFYLFVRERFDQETSEYALWLIAAYPFAVFFGALYTESLFLLGTLGAFYHFTKRQYGRAAMWGIVVGLTRLNGALMVVPLGWLVLFSKPATRPDPKALAAAVAPAAGLAIYVLFIWRLTGDPLAFLSGQVAWGRTYQGLGALVAQQYNIIASAGISGYVGSPGYDVLNAIGAVFAVATIWPVARRLGFAYGVFMLLNIVPALSTGGLLSAGRFSAVLFPAFIWLATAVPPAHRSGWIAVFAMLQGFNAALFYTWRPLF